MSHEPKQRYIYTLSGEEEKSGGWKKEMKIEIKIKIDIT